MWAEPELAGQCRAAGGPDHDIDAVAECAKRKFLNAWAKNDGIVQAPPPDGWSMPANCTASAPPANRKQTLRDLLRARLEAATAADQFGDEVDGTQQRTSDASTADNAPAPPAEAPPPADDNEALCSAATWRGKWRAAS